MYTTRCFLDVDLGNERQNYSFDSRFYPQLEYLDMAIYTIAHYVCADQNLYNFNSTLNVL